MHLDQIVKVILENREIFVAFVLSIIAIIRLTSWGKAQTAALDVVVGVVEQIGAGSVKSRVAAASGKLPAAVKDAIVDSVAKADPKKTPTNLFVRVLREVFRGL